MKKLAFIILLLIPALSEAKIDSIITLPGGSNGEVQFKNVGKFDGDPNFKYSSTTYRIILSSGGIQFPDGSVQVSSAVGGASGNFINNQNSLQSGSTFYVSSGTVDGYFYVNSAPSSSFGNERSVMRISASNNTFGNVHSLSFQRFGSLNPAKLSILSYGSDGSLYSYWNIADIGLGKSFAIGDQGSEYFSSGVGGGDGSTLINSSGTQNLTLREFPAVLNVAGLNSLGQALLHVYSDDGQLDSAGTTKIFEINHSSISVYENLFLTTLTSKDCLGTDSDGKVIEGTCTGGGGGSSSLAVSSRTAAGSVTVVSSPTVTIVGNYPLLVELSGGSTAEFKVDSSSFTMAGNTFNTPSNLVQLDGLGNILNTMILLGNGLGVDGGNGIEVKADSSKGIDLDISGNLALASTGTAGSYTNANITTDIYGRVIAASNGTGGSGDMLLASTQTKTAPLNFVNYSTSPAMKITQYGNVGTSDGTGGAFVIDTGTNTGNGMQIYTNRVLGTQLTGLLYLRSNTTSYNEPMIYMKSNSDSTIGSNVDMRIDAENPDIEFIETDQVSPAGKFEIDVNNDHLQINSRNAADNSFQQRIQMDHEGKLKFKERDDGGDTVGFAPPQTIASSFMWQLPATDGTNGQYWAIQDGTFTWTTPSAGTGSPIAMTTGTSSGYTQALVSTGPLTVIFDQSQFQAYKQPNSAGATIYYRVDPSSFATVSQVTILATSYLALDVFNSSGAATNIQKSSNTIVYNQTLTSTLTAVNGTGQLVRTVGTTIPRSVLPYTIRVTTGSETATTGAYTSTETLNLVFDKNTFLNQLAYGGTDFVRLNPSSATLRGQPSGATDGTKFLRDDWSWQSPAGSGDMILASTQTVTGHKTFTSSVTITSTLTVAGAGSGQISLGNSAGSNFVSIRGPNNISADYNIVVPSTAPEAVGMILEVVAIDGSTATTTWGLDGGGAGGSGDFVKASDNITTGTNTSRGGWTFTSSTTMTSTLTITGVNYVTGLLEGASVYIFTTTGTYTPLASAEFFLVRIVGGGGAGQICDGTDETSGGGGGGGYSERIYNVAEMGASAAVSVGVASAFGSSGTATVFDPAGTGATLTADGGGVALSTTATAIGNIGFGGLGGSGFGGQINIRGGMGRPGFILSTAMGIGGEGGSPGAYFNGGGAGGPVSGALTPGGPGGDANGYGGGGGGCSAPSAADQNPGVPATGAVYILEFR